MEIMMRMNDILIMIWNPDMIILTLMMILRS